MVVVLKFVGINSFVLLGGRIKICFFLFGKVMVIMVESIGLNIGYWIFMEWFFRF